MTALAGLSRAEMCALIIETLADAGIDVALVGGSCVCLYTDERFTSLDLDFIDLTYSRRKEIARALDPLGFAPRGQSKYFEHPDCKWSIEFPTGPLAIGHEQIEQKRLSTLETPMGTVRLLSPTDTIKDRLLWYYLEQDGQCWEQAIEIASKHKIQWRDLKCWHDTEGYENAYPAFRQAVRTRGSNE